MIARRLLFGNPDRVMPSLSPDGARLAFLAPRDGVLNVFVGPVDAPDAARPVTHDTVRGIRAYSWAYTGRHILYLQDAGGDEDWHLYRVDLDAGDTLDLTPGKGLSARIQHRSRLRPGEVLVAVNERSPALHDLFRVDVATGARELVQENPGLVGFVTDDGHRVRLGARMEAGGDVVLLRADGRGGFAGELLRIAFEDAVTTRPVDFDAAGRALLAIDSRGRDTGALVRIDVESGERELVYASDHADVDDVLLHPTRKTVEAVAHTYERRHWEPLDPEVAADLESLRAVADGELAIESRTLADDRWLASVQLDDGPARYYRYDRPERAARFLFANRPALEGAPLARMRPVVIRARDGRGLVSYLTLPRDAAGPDDARPREPQALVLLVHGGPWARDAWGFNPYHQLLADRGYAVLSVNYRGSVGFGKAFVNAGDREWGGRMHDDLIDAVEWAVAEGVADRGRIAIMGGSYGGYATLVGLTFTPEVFACGVDIVGPSNLVTLLETMPAYWQPQVALFKKRTGDHTTPEGRAFLRSRSPLGFVDRIRRPLLIAQGANDPRVKRAESDQIVAAMQAKHIPVTYALYPDEGHGFARPANALSFMALTEAFLARHLGGRCEGFGDVLEGSSVEVVTGAEEIPGLAGALGEVGAQTTPSD